MEHEFRWSMSLDVAQRVLAKSGSKADKRSNVKGVSLMQRDMGKTLIHLISIEEAVTC